jgi:serine protease Do
MKDMIANIYAATAPSVVNIEVEVDANGTAARKTNQGSGLILNKSGSIVTNASILTIALDKQGKILANAHVRVSVFGSVQAFDAVLTGRDLLTGLAVLKIVPGETVLQPAKFAEKPSLKVGQLILSIGYPDELFTSGGLTSGIITGLNRPVILDDGTNLQMIQSNAPISQTCSGGPLLNLSGEVVGLTNCALIRDVTDTMGYALAAETVQQVAKGLIENGFVAGRSWLGVSVLLQESFMELQKLYQLPDGLYISNVIKDSPAYSVDLRKGDIITAINATAVGASMDMSKFLQSQPVGSLVTIRIYRRTDGQYHDFKVYLQEYKQ